MDNVGNSNDVVFSVLSRLFKLIDCNIYDALDDVELTLGIVREETWGDTISLKGLSNGFCFLQGGVGHCRCLACDGIYILNQALEFAFVLLIA